MVIWLATAQLICAVAALCYRYRRDRMYPYSASCMCGWQYRSTSNPVYHCGNCGRPIGGYAPGGIYAAGGGGGGAGGSSYSFGAYTPGLSPLRRQGPSAGIEGFAGDREADFDLALGCVRGLRKWSVQGFNAALNPAGLTADWEPGLLTGTTGYQWGRGVLTASCNYSQFHWPPVDIDLNTGLTCGCVSPEVRVLTADLRWVPAGDLVVGEHLLTFDEYPADRGYQRVAGRKYRDAVVASTDRGKLPCYDLQFEDGTVVRVSADHRWLCYSGQKGSHWVRTDELRAGGIRASHVVKPFTPWETDASREAGYLAAAFDTQLRSYQALRLDGTPRLDMHRLTIGTRPELMRFLGSVRPARLLPKLQPDRLGRLNMANRVRLVSKTYIGEREVVKLGTTSGTYFAEGMASHNCGFWAYWEKTPVSFVPPGPGRRVVEGIIAGTGRTIFGELGFRCEKAQIVALAVPQIPPDTRPYFTDRGRVSYRIPDSVARLHADAWMGVVQDRLQQMYPGAQVFTTRETMLGAVTLGEIPPG